MKYLSLFSGMGGFELGIQQAYVAVSNRNKNGRVKSNSLQDDEKGQRLVATPRESINTKNRRDSKLSNWGDDKRTPTCIGYSEIDKYAIQIYKKHFNHTNYGDITKINATKLPDFDLLTAGFPCQSFSIAGKRGGFDDTRGTLFFDICRIAKAKEPMFMLLENVKGLVSHDGGKTLEVILASLQELGYYVNYEIHNSKDYGVPQNRERIFLLCKHIKLLSSVGQSEKITTSESIIQEWLFTLLLNNLAEVKKLQEHASKDWVVGYLLSKEINQNLELSEGENIRVGTMPTEGSLFQSKEEEVWQNIDTWLNNHLEGDLEDERLSTTLTAINRIIESKTYTYSQMLMSILLATVLLRNSSKSLWNEVLSSLTVIQEDTKYARINNKNEKAIITESGTAHLSAELQDPARYFTLSHLRGTSRPKVFPFTETDRTTDKGFKQSDTESEVASTVRSRYGNGTGSHVAPTIRATQHKSGDNQTAVTEDGMKIRRLTPTECARLQGFPDDWHDGISDTQAYKCYGNSVTVNVVQAIFERLLSISQQ